jgi:hypothetical protein
MEILEIAKRLKGFADSPYVLGLLLHDLGT